MHVEQDDQARKQVLPEHSAELELGEDRALEGGQARPLEHERSHLEALDARVLVGRDQAAPRPAHQGHLIAGADLEAQLRDPRLVDRLVDTVLIARFDADVDGAARSPHLVKRRDRHLDIIVPRRTEDRTLLGGDADHFETTPFDIDVATDRATPGRANANLRYLVSHRRCDKCQLVGLEVHSRFIAARHLPRNPTTRGAVAAQWRARPNHTSSPT